MVQYTTEMEIYLVSEYFSFVTYLKCTLNIPHGQSKIVAFLLINVHLHIQRGTYWEPLMPIKWSIFMHCLLWHKWGVSCPSGSFKHPNLFNRATWYTYALMYCEGPIHFLTRMYFCCLLLLLPYPAAAKGASLSIVWENMSTPCIEW